MQPDLEYSIPPMSSQDQYEAEKVLTGEEDRSLQIAEAADKHQGFFNSGIKDMEIPRGILFGKDSQITKQRRWELSSATWRLAALVGDSTLLIALLVSLTNASQLGLSVPGSVFGSWSTNFVWMCLVLALWSFAVNITQAQQLSCVASLLKSPLYALCSLVLMLIFCIVLLYLFIGNGIISYTKLLLFFLIVAALTLSIWRVSLAEIINLPRFRRQAVIVGINAAGKNLAKELLNAKHSGVNVLGYISESLDSQKQQDGLPVLGGRSALRSLVQDGVIDMIIMAIDYKANPELFQEALEGAQGGISIVPVTAVYESTSGKIPVEHIGDQWYMALPSEQFIKPFYGCWHKMMDLTFGLCGTLALGLVLPILAVLIKLDSPGPVFYSQERSGYRGRTFRILKFRSMCTDADHIEGGAWTTRSDTRVTRVGRFLRVTHMDELPQMLNILRGDMSLIGPRPERPDYVAELEKSNLFYCYRLSVKPGLTGWAQVKYDYGSGKQDELVKLQYDLYYIKYRSFLLDVLIILKTIVEVVLCHGV